MQPDTNIYTTPNQQAFPTESPIPTTLPPVSNQPTIKKKKSHFFGYFITCFSILLIIVTTLCILWATGNLKNFICNRSYDGSFLSKSFDCTSVAKTEFKQENTVNIDTSKITNQEQLITEIVGSTSPAVVTIAASTSINPDQLDPNTPSQTAENIGSGFIIRKDGLILTNSHVVSDNKLEYYVILSMDSKPIPVKKITKDTANDIALVQIEKDNLPVLKLGDSDKLKVGNTVIAIGSPLGDLTSTVTSGIVSALNREVKAGDLFQSRSFFGVIQTDAAINPGNSGGPLLNSTGEVIGINFASVRDAANISFALPINRVKTKLAEFEKNGKFTQPYVGIAFTQKTYYLRDGTLTGALVTQVQKESPADKAGLKSGDVILKANDKSLETESLQNIITNSTVGDTLTLKVWYKGNTREIIVKIGDRSDFE